MVFLSRIVPMKNLLYAIEILNDSYIGSVEFNIYGLIEDREYWDKCEKAIAKLPSNIRCEYCGSVKPDESTSVFAENDVFLFPSRGENFGHVIFESLFVDVLLFRFSCNRCKACQTDLALKIFANLRIKFQIKKIFSRFREKL